MDYEMQACPLQRALGPKRIPFKASLPRQGTVVQWFKRGSSYAYIVDVSKEDEPVPFFQLFASSLFPSFNREQNPELEITYQRNERIRQGMHLLQIDQPVYKGIEDGNLECIDFQRKAIPLNSSTHQYKSFPPTFVASKWGRQGSNEVFIYFECRSELKRFANNLESCNLNKEIYNRAKEAMERRGIPIQAPKPAAPVQGVPSAQLPVQVVPSAQLPAVQLQTPEATPEPEPNYDRLAPEVLEGMAARQEQLLLKLQQALRQSREGTPQTVVSDATTFTGI